MLKFLLKKIGILKLKENLFFIRLLKVLRPGKGKNPRPRVLANLTKLPNFLLFEDVELGEYQFIYFPKFD